MNKKRGPIYKLFPQVKNGGPLVEIFKFIMYDNIYKNKMILTCKAFFDSINESTKGRNLFKYEQFNIVLSISVITNNIRMVKFCLNDDTISLNYNFNCMIKIASNCGYSTIVKLLFSDKRHKLYGNNNNYLMRNAIIFDKLDLVMFFVKNKIFDKNGELELIEYAFKNGYMDLIKLLLSIKYFSPNDYKNYPIVLASYNNHPKIVKLLLKDKRVDPSDSYNDAICYAAKFGHLEVVKLLLKDKRVNPSDSNNDNNAINLASAYGHLEVVKLLLKDKRTDPSVNNNYPIRIVSCKGYIEIVKLLLKDKRVDPSDDYNYAIRRASEYGHLEVVKLLLKDKRVDPSALDNDAICFASENGHLEVVKLLLQRMDRCPKNENEIIRNASINGHYEIVRLILKKLYIFPYSSFDNGSLIYKIGTPPPNVVFKCNRALFINVLRGVLLKYEEFENKK